MAAKVTEYTSLFDAPKYSNRGINETKYRIKTGLTLPEAQIKVGAFQVLGLHKIPYWRIDVQGKIIHTGEGCAIQGPSGMKGMADIIGIYKSKFLAIELKKKGGYASQSQINFLKTVNEHHGIGVICSDYTVLNDYLNDEWSKIDFNNTIEGVLVL